MLPPVCVYYERFRERRWFVLKRPRCDTKERAGFKGCLLVFCAFSCRQARTLTGNLEVTLPDKRGVGNQICWNNARFFEYTGTNAFSRIQKVPILQDRFRAKTRLFPTYQDLAECANSILVRNGVGTLWPNLNRLSRLVPCGKAA